jgi:hypothetical protein
MIVENRRVRPSGPDIHADKRNESMTKMSRVWITILGLAKVLGAGCKKNEVEAPASGQKGGTAAK